MILTQPESDIVPLTAEHMAVLAQQLDEAIEEFRALGVTLRDQNRLLKASRILKDVSGRGAFPEQHTELSRVVESIRIAQEFVEIANVLPSTPIPPVVSDLRLAVAGELDSTAGANKSHLQHQSQLWVGSMLVAGGATAGVLIRPSGPSPDFVVPNGTLNYAVEVKRPFKALDARNIVRGAARQVRAPQYHGGVIVVDLTDCLLPDSAVQFVQGEPCSDHLQKRLNGLVRDLHNEVFNDTPEVLRAGREHVFALIGFTRMAYWNELDLSQPYVGRLVSNVIYWRRNSGTLRAHRARWLAGLLHAGLQGSASQEVMKVDLNFEQNQSGAESEHGPSALGPYCSS